MADTPIKLSCMCLNVQFRIAKQNVQLAQPLTLRHPSKEPVENVFVRPIWLTSFLDQQIVHSRLLTTSEVTNDGAAWSVRRCMICNRDIFATTSLLQGGSKVLVNSTAVVVRIGRA
jgi:hypothetical protein